MSKIDFIIKNTVLWVKGEIEKDSREVQELKRIYNKLINSEEPTAIYELGILFQIIIDELFNELVLPKYDIYDVQKVKLGEYAIFETSGDAVTVLADKTLTVSICFENDYDIKNKILETLCYIEKGINKYIYDFRANTGLNINVMNKKDFKMIFEGDITLKIQNNDIYLDQIFGFRLYD